MVLSERDGNNKNHIGILKRYEDKTYKKKKVIENFILSFLSELHQ